MFKGRGSANIKKEHDKWVALKNEIRFRSPEKQLFLEIICDHD